MSLIENIQNLFKPKNKLPEDSMDMASVGMPVDPFATGAMNVVGDGMSPEATANMMARQAETDKEPFAPSMMFNEEAPAAAAAEANPELLKLPILGSKTIAQHQRTLLLMLGLSVLVLAVVAYRALSQADTITREITATGESLMQSQRLAKSVSQALVGSAQAFPDVKESASVLAFLATVVGEFFAEFL